MSRLYFHTSEDEAELMGWEAHWLRYIASGPGAAAWDLTRDASSYERAMEIMAMVPEPTDDGHGANYLHTYLRAAQDQEANNRAVYAASEPGEPYHGRTSYEPQHRFVSALQTALRGSGVDLEVAGHRLRSENVELNTALAAGSDVIRLAAKISGWDYVWVDGPDRAWMAGIIEQGLRARIFRPDAGWDNVRAFLLAHDDEPVVLSHSTSDSFPDPDIGGWMPPWPEGIPHTWEGWDLMTPEQAQERTNRREEWYELPHDEQWRISMEALRERRPWARLAPDTLATETFGPAVTVYTLLAPDRDDLVRAICDAD
jgi:hypothetical protein